MTDHIDINENITIYHGDCLEVMQGMTERSVHMCVTSPPYWGLRDYGTAQWEGGGVECDHLVREKGAEHAGNSGLEGGTRTQGHQQEGFKVSCPRCGARRIDQQIGLEKTPELYIEKIVEVFRGVWRILRDDGTLWLNLGDSYSTGACNNHTGLDEADRYNELGTSKTSKWAKHRKVPPSLKPKDLCGIPWRVALALQADGWYLRSAAPWVKRSAMPESCTDRPASALEYMFLLTKKPNYYYDAEAVRVGDVAYTRKAGGYTGRNGENASRFGGKGGFGDSDVTTVGRNRRNSDWWFESVGMLMYGDEIVGFDVKPQAFSAAHFATYPEKLIEPCILAGTSEKGCCPECKTPWERVVEKKQIKRERPNDRTARHEAGEGINSCGNTVAGVKTTTIGWRPGCECGGFLQGTRQVPELFAIPCTVFDPFHGAGTTALVAYLNNRNYIGIELSSEYIEISRQRIEKVTGQFALFEG